MSISTRTTVAFALFALLCAGLTGAVLSSMSNRDLENVIVDRQRLFAMQGALAFLDHVELAIEELRHISSMVEVDLDDDDDAPERRVLNEAWRLTLFFNGRVLLTDETGRCHGSEPEHDACIGLNFSDERWFLESVETGEPTVSFHEGDSTVAVVVPIQDEDGALEGVLRGEIELERGDFFDDSVHGTEVEHDLALVNAQGDVLFVGGNPALDSRPWQSAIERSSQPGAVVVEVDGERTAMAWSPIGTTEARLVYAWPWSKLDHASDERRNALLIAATVVAAFGIMVGFLVARRLTQPVLLLAGEVRAARGTRARIEAKSSADEVGSLRRAFTELVDELKAGEAAARRDHERVAELADTLEERVQQRTKELEETRDALIASERLAALGHAGAALSHEIRNSLNALSVGMDALGGKLPDTARHDVRQHVRAEIGRLRTLADVLLDFARPRSLVVAPVRADALLENSLALVEDFAQERSVTIDVVDDASTTELHVDSSVLQSVLTNLIRNAVEATAGQEEPRRRVQIRSRVVGDEWCVDVEDRGAGIADEVRERLFQPFSSGRVGGVGLGLALSRRFAEMHAGRLELVEGELEGACFRASIPLQSQTTQRVAS